MSAIPADLYAELADAVNRWAVGGNGTTASTRDAISFCSAELAAIMDRHPRSQPDAEPEAQYALVELMGHRAMVAKVREVTFLGEPRLEVHRIDVVPEVTVTVGPESIYALTSLTADQAHDLARTYGRSTGGLDAAGVITRYISDHRQAIAAGGDDVVDADIVDDDYDREQSERELAEEGNLTAMSQAERDEYDRDAEFALDAADEAADLEREAEADANGGFIGDEFDEDDDE